MSTFYRGEIDLKKAYIWAFIAKKNGFKTNGALKIIKSEMSDFEMNRAAHVVFVLLRAIHTIDKAV